MLLIDGKPFDLTAEIIKNFKTKHGLKESGVVTFQYVDSLYTKTTDANGRQKTVYPPFVTLGTVATVRKTTGIEQWTYCEVVNNSVTTASGDKIITEYTPRHLRFANARPLNLQDDIELIYFLLKCSPGVQDGENAPNASVHLIKVLNPAKEAANKIATKRLMAEANALLFSEKTMLPETRLRKIAKIMLISGVDDMDSVDEVIAAIDERISSGAKAKQSLEQFIRLSDSIGAIDEVRGNIQSAVDARIIVFQASKRGWYYADSKGAADMNSLITLVSAAADSKEGLFTHLSSDESEYKLLKNALRNHKIALIDDEILTQKKTVKTGA